MNAVDGVSPLRVLVAGHGHPRISQGGSEIAAHGLFQALTRRSDVTAWFLGCDRDGRHARPGSAISQPFSDREFLYAATAFDWFKFANHDPKFPREMVALLQELRPDIVHFHHFINFGVEVFQLVRRTLPHARIVLTLHEYLAICHHFGQMVTTGTHHLCHEATDTRCHACFPDFAASDFFLRKRYISQFFDDVDHFIAPSHFLAERFVRWGLPPAKVRMIENVVPPATSSISPPRRDQGDLLRIGFFGQISHLKGSNVLFGAADLLEKQEINGIAFEIHGDYSSQSADVQAAFLKRLDAVSAHVTYHGPYQNEHVDTLMQGVDAILVPSVWWENAPVVIEEALRNRRPVLCSSIGGMAEKVRDGLDGFHFRTGSPAALADLVKRLHGEPEVLMRLRETMRSPVSVDPVVDSHMALYRGLIASRAGSETSPVPISDMAPALRRRRMTATLK